MYENQFFGESVYTYNFNIPWFNKVSAVANLVIDASRKIQTNTKYIFVLEFFLILDLWSLSQFNEPVFQRLSPRNVSLFSLKLNDYENVCRFCCRFFSIVTHFCSMRHFTRWNFEPFHKLVHKVKTQSAVEINISPILSPLLASVLKLAVSIFVD